MTHKMFFDRSDSTIKGVLTLQRVVNGKVIKVFDKLPVASGQRGSTETDWENRKSPTPYGVHWLRTKAVPLQMSPRGTPFFPIGSTQTNIGVIRGPQGQLRVNCGLHLENEFPGTWGCTALEHYTEEQSRNAWALFHYLESLWPMEKYIPYEVL